MTARWIVITDYPRWPSPYFQQLAASLPSDFGLEFQPALNKITNIYRTPGMINLHRLARLYRNGDSQPDADCAAATVAELDQLRACGWRLVWTVHNILPIRAQTSDPIDEWMTEQVLARTDALIAHTASDARALNAMRPRGTVLVGGSAGLDAIPDQPPTAPITALADRLAEATPGLLVLGNIAAYKGLPHIAKLFLEATANARLVIAGRPADPPTVALLRDLEYHAHGRIVLYADHVPPGNTRLLCQAATALLCPYRIDGPFAFFRRALFPSSVAMATGFGVPVIAPDLPSIRELTERHPRALYATDDEAADVFARVDSGEQPWDYRRAEPGPANRWHDIAQVYLQLAARLTTTSSGMPLA